jgi:hypothetical protein
MLDKEQERRKREGKTEKEKNEKKETHLGNESGQNRISKSNFRWFIRSVGARSIWRFYEVAGGQNFFRKKRSSVITPIVIGGCRPPTVAISN